MALKVRLSDRARADIEEIANYLGDSWSETVKLDFLMRLTDQLKLISEMPYIFKSSQTKNGLRECVLNKHTIIYYQVVNDEMIQVITIRNTRRENH